MPFPLLSRVWHCASMIFRRAMLDSLFAIEEPIKEASPLLLLSRIHIGCLLILILSHFLIWVLLLIETFSSST